ncbi:acyl-CoA thioesterase [Aeromicrobium sp. UC242_57]|uniref:acyl-CoA thioesterase n=1 Tax=Aeromicrobium sp. UC242_57 TaxID=3374624 RepID=UPI00378A90F7
MDDKLVHSSHTTFLRGGLSGLPVTYQVNRLRDGRNMATREVSAWQGDRLLCRSTISCAAPSEGLSHSRLAPQYPGPDDCPSLQEVSAVDGGLGEYWDDFSTVEVRLAPDPAEQAPHSAAPPNAMWMRCTDQLPDDPLVHRATLAYISDLMLMSTAVTPHGHVSGHERSLASRWNAVSLDHSMWFRGDIRADEWMLFEHTTPLAHEGRALIEAAVFDQAGTSLCQVAQKLLIRPI